MKHSFWKAIKQSMTLFVARGKSGRTKRTVEKTEERKSNERVRGTNRTKRNTDSLRHDFLRFSQLHISRMKDKRSASTLQNYATAVRSLTTFLKTRDGSGNESPISLPIHKIDRHLIQQYDRWLMLRGVSVNTRSCYLRSLRAIYNEHPLICNEHTLARARNSKPFQDVFTGNAPTRKRAISLREVKMIELADNSSHGKEKNGTKRCSELAKTQDIFLFSLYAMGMPFVDLYHLRQSQIKDNVLTYRRHKTGQTVSVKLEPCMREIVGRHHAEDCEYIFATLHTKDYPKALNQYNRQLKALAKQAGVISHLTSYVARHTWASLAYRQKIALPIISQAMGHTNIKTTMIYIRQLDCQQIFCANNKLLKKLKFDSCK